MQGGVIGGIFLLAFLLSVGCAEELEVLKEDPKNAEDLSREIKETVDLKESSESKAPDDLKSEVSLAVTESNSQEDDDGRSGAMAHSSSHSFGGSSMSNAVAHSHGGGSSSAYSAGVGGSSQSKASAVARDLQASPRNPFISDISPYIPPGLSQAEAQAISDSVDSYGQGQNLYPYSPFPYSSGSSSAQAQAEAENGYYQPPIATPLSSPYNQGLNSAQAQAQANDGFSQLISRPSPNLSPYYQGSSSAQAQAQVISESYKPIIEPTYKVPEPIPRLNPVLDSLSNFPSSYPYSQGSSFAQAQSQADEPYESVPIPDSSLPQSERFLPPNKGSSFGLSQGERESYQTIPILSPYSQGLNSGSGPSLSYPYSSPRFNSAKSGTQADNEYPYQPVPIPDTNPSLYDHFLVPYKGTDSTQGQLDSETYQPIPFPDPNPSPYESFMVPYKTKAEVESMSSYSLSYPNNQVRSGGLNQAYENDDFNRILRSKSDRNSHVYNPYQPGGGGPNPKLYPSGADAAQAYGDVKPGAYPYNLGMSPYAYPSESPFRPGGYNLPENGAQGLPNTFVSGQSSPIVFEDAQSRIILPDEYVFPNKMPGGDNAVQCTKENEFHHFWSQALDCLVCICLNEYGLLSPVCASCGGCHNPPPKHPELFPRLPEPIPVRPASPEPFEPVSIMPEPLPVPQPEQKPQEPYPNPEPYPLYPEPIQAPSSNLEPVPEPIPTLPPPHASASCNPLPSETPFTNPLHPCQICVCRESYASGKPDVQIHCKENPQCITPADVTTLPPLPDVPVPIPLPMCEKFPEHVLFPHPTDSCKLCKCSKSIVIGQLEQQITCYPHPVCIPKEEPITEPDYLVPPPLPILIEPYQVKPTLEPAEPLREPFPPMEPVPLPEIVTVEPLPWPPITTIAPMPTTVTTLPVLTPRPGPLPGPSPHESCRPYPPNQTFQHPWDECQICLCTEAFAVGMITVEVNCYTKPSCCIEPPDSVQQGYNKPYPGISNVANGLNLQALSSAQPPSVILTSTYKPPAQYSSYTPRPVNIYPVSSQGSGAEILTPPGYAPAPYNRIQPDDAFANPPSSYTYQPNYHPGYVNPQYPEYPPRLPAPSNTVGPYKPNNYGYPGTYHYGQGDAIENSYPGPQGHYQSYDPRYQGAQTPNLYPSLYQRPNYEMPLMYPPGKGRESYAQASSQAGPNAQSSAQSYAEDRMLRPKTGNDGPDDLDDS